MMKTKALFAGLLLLLLLACSGTAPAVYKDCGTTHYR
jgi:hypothetical protein